MIKKALELFYEKFESMINRYKNINKVFEILVMMFVLMVLVACLAGLTWLIGWVTGNLIAFFIILGVAIFVIINIQKVEREKKNGKE